MNSFGRIFRISIFGESHNHYMGISIDGIPSGISLKETDFTEDMDRRRPARKGTTPRKEADLPLVVSGTYEGCTTGAPLTILFENENVHSWDYAKFEAQPRPGHSDFTASAKYNFFNDPRGSGHFSGRLTAPLVAAGVVAKKILGNIRVQAEVTEVGGKKEGWNELLDQAIREGDSLGAIVECRCSNMPVGLGEPFFDSCESILSHLIFSIPGVRGIEFGDGFAAAAMKGSEHNDPFIDNNGNTSSNGAGGINGGISNGNEIVFRVAFKPTSSIAKPQQTFNFITGEMESLEIKGRHDVCFALRTPVIVEAVAAIALADLTLQNQSRMI